MRLATACGGDPSGLRDRGLGSAALVGLDAEHIRLTPTAAEATLDVLGSEHAPEGVAGWA